jgi:TDG/mug DNA glycosylase family protein
VASVLPDVLAPNLRLVVCGSAAGRVSAQRGHYYAGPGNKLWRTLAATGLTTEQLAPADYARVLAFGIGLTDLVQDQSGGDHEIEFARAGRDALRAKIARYRPAVLAFNGKRAAREFFGRPVDFGVQDAAIGATRLFVAPSTSGAAARSWSFARWQELAEFVRSCSAVRTQRA